MNKLTGRFLKLLCGWTLLATIFASGVGGWYFNEIPRNLWVLSLLLAGFLLGYAIEKASKF